MIALSWEYVGGAQGFRNIRFNPFTLEYVIGIIIVLLLFFARLERSSLGRAMDSIHQDETAAEVMGIDVVRIKLLAFGLGAVIAGLAGALYAHHATYMDSTTFNIMLGGRNPDVRGGRRRQHLLGAAVRRRGAERHSRRFLRALREWLELVPVEWTNFYPMNRVYDFLHDFLDFENAKRLIAYGVILIVMMIFRPDGLLTRDSLRRLRLPRWKARHA